MSADNLDDQLEYDQTLEADDSDVPEKYSSEASDDNGSGDDASSSTTNNTKQTLDKKAKAKAKQKERKRIKNEMDKQQKEHLALSEPPIIADYIVKLISKANPKLTAIELQDRSVPESQIVFTGDAATDRKNIDSFKPFFEHFELNKKPKPGKDLVLVLCISAIRVCNVVRALRTSNKGGALKLIKQNKPDYDKRCLKSPAHIAVSTPGRIFKLRELRILDFKRIKKVVVDTSLLDAKQRTIWDIENCIPLVSELAHKYKAKVFLY